MRDMGIYKLLIMSILIVLYSNDGRADNEFRGGDFSIKMQSNPKGIPINEYQNIFSKWDIDSNLIPKATAFFSPDARYNCNNNHEETNGVNRLFF